MQLRAPYAASGSLYKLVKDAEGLEIEETYEEDALILEFMVRKTHPQCDMQIEAVILSLR